MTELSKIYKTKNKWLLISLKNDKTTLNNGLMIEETRGKKDIVSGIIESSEDSNLTEGKIVWFPMYSALPIVLPRYTGNEQLFLVNIEDICLEEI